MFLRSLTIRGFKSFADKTVLEFGPGISAIVGPNGSGKSNLVDAISWVLGEQGPRALRGGQMADVIFAGSPTRPALGMAEVRLVIDNSAGLIPVPMTEIEISRTIFRSGESEYRIGGEVVRLLDVQELLSETGIGRALHTVVGQGQLEEVLTARPEDRRRYIEEAAGIAKHRRRRERAERKLAGLDQDLLRLQDVLAELRRQLKPLRQQAEVARRHEELTAQAEELSRRLAAARLRDLLAERERRRAGWEEGLALRETAKRRLQELDEEVGRAADARVAATAALQEAEAAFREARAEREAAEAAYREALDREARLRADLADHAARGGRAEAVAEELARAEAERSRTAEELARKERELARAEAEFQDRERLRRAVEEERRRLAEEAAARRAEVETIRGALAASERDRERLERSLAEIRERIVAAEAEATGLRTEIERLDAAGAPLAERRAALEQERRGLVEEVSELEEQVRRHEARRDLLSERRRDLEETAGSRLLERKRGRAIGLLREMVEATDGLGRPLLAALGPFADAVVYEDADAAIADAPEGDGAILAIASGGPVAFVLPGERSLLSAVRAEPAARGLVSTLLRDVYLAASLSEAAEKHARHPRASFVTPDGILVGPAVIHTAPAASDRAREVRAELRLIEHDLAVAHQRLRPKRGRLEDVVRELEELDAELEALDAEIAAAAERLAVVEREAAGARREAEVLEERLAGLDDAARGWRERLAAVDAPRPELPELPRPAEPPVRLRVEVEALRRDLAATDERLARLRAEREALAAVDPEALRAELARAGRDREAAEAALREAGERASEAAAARDRAAEAERRATEAEADANRRWREASAELERLRDAYEEEDRARGDLERRIREAERLLREGHGADPAEAVAALGEADTIQALERQAELVQRRLALLGRVNLLATGELETLEERHDFLQRELEDVRKARRDLLEVIRRIDEEMTRTFEAAYRDAAAEFERIFAQLFPGGEGRLVLTDPARPLEAGIEIEARPGRKRVRRISLLSGGERALVALAFLFAIFRARPSPFYLMDEVEPALDDVNLVRFLDLVRAFAADAQVLIVTHQKRTMEVADVLYGVSMNRDGTSTVVCQRIDQPPAAATGAGHPGAQRLPEVPTTSTATPVR